MDKRKIVNVTNHDITMLFCEKLKNNCPYGKNSQKCRECQYGNIKNIEPSGISIKASTEESFEKERGDVVYVSTPNSKSKRELAKLENEYFNMGINAIFVGSLIAAQAFPERVVAMVPVPGYERVPVEKKLVRSDKFTIFPEK